MDLALPNLHPAIVHFPVVLIPAAMLVDILALWWRTRVAERAASTVWVLAALATTAAYLAGRAAADGLVDVPALVQPSIADHADWAGLTLGVAWGLTAARVGLAFARRWRWVIGVRGLLITASVALVGLMAVTADKGGSLVYEHAVAVAVAAPDCPVCEDQAAARSAPAGTPELVDVGGTLTWLPRPGDDLPDGMRAWPARGLAVAVDGRQRLLFPAQFGDVQVTAWVDLSAFTGDVGVVHHVEGHRGGGFLVSSAGQARLVDIESGAALDPGTATTTGVVQLAVSAAGHHLKGMVNGVVASHAHEDPLPAGQVGLVVDGTGVLVIERIEVVPLDEHQEP